MSETPYLSVIMPVRNEGAFLERALGCVLAQDYPADRFEIIVADGMSTDSTRTLLSLFAERDPRIRVVDNPGRIVPTGMNIALREARGEIIVRVDGHCEIERDYLSLCVEHLKRPDVDGVGGPVITVGDTLVAQTIALAMSSPFGVGGSTFRTVEDRTVFADTIPFPAYRLSTIQRVGLYDEELVRNQDDEYNYRLRKHGAKLLLAADVRSKYYSRGTLRKLWRQYYQYGFWKVRVMQKHPRQMSVRQFAPVTLVLAFLTTTIAACFSVWGMFGLGGLISAYAGSNFAGTIKSIRKITDWRQLFLLPMCFTILHFSYGCGFLVGLVWFCRRWGEQTPTIPLVPKELVPKEMVSHA